MLPDSVKKKTTSGKASPQQTKEDKGTMGWLLTHQVVQQEDSDPAGIFTEVRSGSLLRFWVTDVKDLKTTRSVWCETRALFFFPFHEAVRVRSQRIKVREVTLVLCVCFSFWFPDVAGQKPPDSWQKEKKSTSGDIRLSQSKKLL